MEIRIKHRYFLRTREARKTLEIIKMKYPKLFSKIENQLGNNIEIIITNLNYKIYLIKNKTIMIETNDGKLIPFITALQLCNDDLPRVVVDMGAVPFIVNGADVMAPGIVRIEGKFDAGDIVVITDEKHGKAFAVGLALVSSEEVKNMKRGKAIRNIHHVGDKMWKFLKMQKLF